MLTERDMTKNEFIGLCEANKVLPENMFFAYLRFEIIDFSDINGDEPSVELSSGETVNMLSINRAEITIEFD